MSGKCLDIICMASFRWILSSAFATSLSVVSGDRPATHSKTSLVGLLLHCLISANSRNTSAGTSNLQARCTYVLTPTLSSRLSSCDIFSRSSDPGVMTSLSNTSSAEKYDHESFPVNFLPRGLNYFRPIDL